MDSTKDKLAELRQAFATTTSPWQKKRLTVVAEMVSTTKAAKEIAEANDVSRRTVMYWHRTFHEKGVEALLARGKSTGRPATLTGRNQKEFKTLMKAGTFKTTADAQQWIYRRTSTWLTLRGVNKLQARIARQRPSAQS